MKPRRITIVASELLGRAGTGGAGTADSLLAVALGRHGHQVELLVASGRDIGPLSPEWTRSYLVPGVNPEAKKYGAEEDGKGDRNQNRPAEE